MKLRINYIGILLACASIAATSCHDDLNIVQPSQFTSRSMWTEENDATTAVNGMFSQLRSATSDNITIHGELRSNLYKSGGVNDAFFNRIGTNEIMMNDAGTNWSEYYTTINSANLILKHVDDITFNRQEDHDNIMANAYFVRAYCYYQIARIWGNAPLLTSGFESESQEDMYPSRGPVADIFALVESDLRLARDLARDTKSLHKASRSSISMLSADYYLWKASRLGGGKEYYQKALDEVNSVIGAGYSLEEDWASIFATDNKNCDEFIFTFPYVVGENVTPGKSPNYFSYYLAPMSDATRLEANGFTSDYVPAGSHAQYIVPSDDYMDFLLSDPTDQRGPASVRRFTEKFVVEDCQVDRVILKFKGTWQDNTRIFNCDMPLYRLAEAYLLKAEAENGLGNQTAAMQSLNIIAKRAHGVDNFYSGLSQEGVTNAIIDESKMEFVAEGKMWWVYMRTNTEFKKISTLVGRENVKNLTLWPVANACITSNPKIEQTEGYN